MEPTDEAIEEALRRAGTRGWITATNVRNCAKDNRDTEGDEARAILAFALYIDETQAFRQEVSDAVVQFSADNEGLSPNEQALFSRFILPQPDPDADLAREVAESVDCETSLDNATVLALATIKRLREQGRLKDAQ